MWEKNQNNRPLTLWEGPTIIGKEKKPKTLSKERANQLQSENKCFECEKVGHLRKDCPTHMFMKPPKVHSSAISFA